MELVKKEPVKLHGEEGDENFFYRRLQTLIFDECENLDIYMRYAQLKLMVRRVEDCIISMENGDVEEE